MTPTTTSKKSPTRKPAKTTTHAPRKPRVTHAKLVEAKKLEPVAAEAAVAAEPAKHVVRHHTQSIYAVGKRKTAVAQILLSSGNGTITINQLPLENYFQTTDLRYIVMQPINSIGLDKQLNVKVKISGGGIHAQSEALRHAISRALLKYNPETRKVLKKQGFLTRDPRVKERKKPGLKRARRAPQFSKR